MKPKIGEYWYFWNIVEIRNGQRYHKDEMLLAKVVVADKEFAVHVNGLIKRVYPNDFIQKWEPNWFYKLLGYR